MGIQSRFAILVFKLDMAQRQCAPHSLYILLTRDFGNAHLGDSGSNVSHVRGWLVRGWGGRGVTDGTIGRGGGAKTSLDGGGKVFMSKARGHHHKSTITSYWPQQPCEELRVTIGFTIPLVESETDSVFRWIRINLDILCTLASFKCTTECAGERTPIGTVGAETYELAGPFICGRRPTPNSCRIILPNGRRECATVTPTVHV